MASTAVVGYLHLQWTVASINAQMEAYRSNTDARHDLNKTDIETLRLEINTLETDVAWLKDIQRRPR